MSTTSEGRSTLLAMDAPTPVASADAGGHAWHIEPSGPLRGDVRVAGSKNAVTKHMVAALMADSPSTITNAPAVGDVGITADILRSIGLEVVIDGGSITVVPTAEPTPTGPPRVLGPQPHPDPAAGSTAPPRPRGVRPARRR